MGNKIIIEAVRMHHKISGATDGRLLAIWRSLEPKTQERYLKAWNKANKTEKQERNDAPGTDTEPNS